MFDPLAEGEVGGQESEADTESLPGAASEAETVEVPERTVDSDPIPMERRLRAAPGAFASLYAVDLHEVFELRARAMRSVPAVLEGGVPSSDQGLDARNLERLRRTAKSEPRYWKLFRLFQDVSVSASQGRRGSPQEVGRSHQTIPRRDRVSLS